MVSVGKGLWSEEEKVAGRRWVGRMEGTSENLGKAEANRLSQRSMIPPVVSGNQEPWALPQFLICEWRGVHPAYLRFFVPSSGLGHRDRWWDSCAGKQLSGQQLGQQLD